MKPGKHDIKTKIRIQGVALDALHEIAFVFTECFGLDSRIGEYKGKREIGLYSWDFECLIVGIECAISDETIRSSMEDGEINALTDLLDTINQIYRETYR